MKRRELISFAALFAIVFISRLPFLSPGFGTDEDAWRTIKAAKDLAITGAYHYSRKPGFPVLEYVYSWIWNKDPVILNGITAFFSAIAALFFALAVRKHRIGSPFWAGLMFAFSPVVYISSTMTIDYMWAMAFIMISYYLLINRRYMFSALFLGFATGCRVTSAAIALPFAIMIFANEKDHRNRILDTTAFVIIVTTITVMFYYPIYTIYGEKMFKFPVGGRPPLSELSQIFGNVGILAIVFFLFVSVILKLKTKSISNFKAIFHRDLRKNIEIWLAIVVIYTILYLDMPHEPAYLIPGLPFLIMSILPFFKANLFKIATVFVILSSFVDIGCGGNNPGHLLANYKARRKFISDTQEVITFCRNNIRDAVIISNYFAYPLSMLGDKPLKNNNIIFKYKLTNKEAAFLNYIGYTIYYLPDIKNTLSRYEIEKFSQPLPLTSRDK